MSTVTISVFAEKGGVGKTTLTYNLGGCLAELGHRVLLIDMDVQANLTKLFLPETDVLNLRKSQTVASLFDTDPGLITVRCLHTTKRDNISFVASNRFLAEHYVVGAGELKQAQWAIANFISDLPNQFAYILIDTAPGINLLPGWAALLGSDYVLTPVEPERFSTQSLNGVWMQLEAAKQVHPKLEFLGYILNKLNGRRTRHKTYEQALRREFKKEVWQTVVTDLSSFGDSQHEGEPVVLQEPRSVATRQIRDATNEMLQRIVKLQESTRKKTTKPKRKHKRKAA